MPFKTILLASHDTAGARAAEEAAMILCQPGGQIIHLVVVPDFWKGMRGDDWLNNASTQETFGNYVEDQLAAEIKQHSDRLCEQVEAAGLNYQIELRQGKPDECLVAFAAEHAADLVVVGARRPKGAEGFRSTVLTDNLMRNLSLPLYRAPYPNE